MILNPDASGGSRISHEGGGWHQAIIWPFLLKRLHDDGPWSPNLPLDTIIQNSRNFCIQFRIALKYMRIQCRGQENPSSCSWIRCRWGDQNCKRKFPMELPLSPPSTHTCTHAPQPEFVRWKRCVWIHLCRNEAVESGKHNSMKPLVVVKKCRLKTDVFYFR